MKIFATVTILSLGILFTLGCRKVINAFRPVVHGSGTVITQTRDTPSFTGIRIEVNADVHVSQTADKVVSIQGEDNILALLHSEVKGGELVISSDKDYEATKPLTITISSPTMESVELDGSGSIKGETPLHADNFRSALAGSGTVDLSVTADKLESSLVGSGVYTLKGKATDLKASVEGSGTYHAFDLETVDATVSIDGSGDAEVNCKDELKASVNGSGDIDYKGNPAQVHTSMNGSGSVTKK